MQAGGLGLGLFRTLLVVKESESRNERCRLPWDGVQFGAGASGGDGPPPRAQASEGLFDYTDIMMPLNLYYKQAPTARPGATEVAQA